MFSLFWLHVSFFWQLCHILRQEKVGGKVIHRQGGVIFLFRGRNYNYRTRPCFPLMLWKPVAPVYPRLVTKVPGGLTPDEATEMRARGRQLPPICKLGKASFLFSEYWFLWTVLNFGYFMRPLVSGKSLPKFWLILMLNSLTSILAKFKTCFCSDAPFLKSLKVPYDHTRCVLIKKMEYTDMFFFLNTQEILC